MVQYDQKVIYTFADRLYRTATRIIALYTVIGALIGFAGGFTLGQGFGLMALVGLVVVAGIGYLLGTQRAFMLKLQAQTALCQAKIEENSRMQASTGTAVLS